MFIFKKLSKIIGPIIFVIIFIFFSTLHAKNFEKYNNAENLSDYFSGILLLSQSKYSDSYDFLKKLDGLEKSHFNFSIKYIYTLINSGNFNQAYSFSKKMDREKRGSFETDLIIGINYLKNLKHDLAKEQFLKAKKRKITSVLNNYILADF